MPLGTGSVGCTQAHSSCDASTGAAATADRRFLHSLLGCHASNITGKLHRALRATHAVHRIRKRVVRRRGINVFLEVTRHLKGTQKSGGTRQAAVYLCTLLEIRCMIVIRKQF